MKQLNQARMMDAVKTALPGKPFAPREGCSLTVIPFDAWHTLPASIRRQIELYKTRTYSDGVYIWVEMASYRVADIMEAWNKEQAEKANA